MVFLEDLVVVLGQPLDLVSLVKVVMVDRVQFLEAALVEVEEQAQ
jgi:hypothetical protein